jgi:Phosphotransferase enzyme family
MSSSSGPSSPAVFAPDLPEALLNRLLRRVDWRFLLPAPRVRQAVCFADGELRDGLALVAERIVPFERAVAGDCDLAVVVDPDGPMLEAASAALRPGGVCYIEWTRFGSGSRRRLAARLRAAGLEYPRSYLAWRSRSRAMAWVPLDSANATRYFQRQLHARSPGRQFPARLVRTCFTFGTRAGIVRPLCMLARKPDAAENGDGAPIFFETIRRDWSRWGLAGRPDDLSLMLLTGGPRSGSKIAGLVFAGSDPHPPLIVKLARVAEAGPGLLREAATLRAVETLCHTGLAQTPRVVFSIEDDALVAVGETALRGVPLLTVLNRRNYRPFALQATDWLVKLANSSRRNDSPSAGRLVREALADFELKFGSVIEAHLLVRTRQILSRLGGLPSVYEHRDFSPWNLFVTPDSRLVVFDWESSELDGLPALDLLYFLVYLGSALDRENTTRGVLRASRAVLDSTTLPGAVHRECLDRYAEGVGLDSTSLPALSLLLWIVHSRSEYHRLAADAAGRPTDSALRGSLFLQLWKAELLRQGTN